MISVFLTPFMPQVAAKIQSQLGLEAKGQDLDSVQEWGGLAGELPIAKGIPLFPKKDQNQMPQKEADSDSPTDATADNLITIDQVKNLEFRVCQIVSAELVSDSDRLLKLIVDLGNEQRQIVAGIAHTYAPQDVIGKQVVVVANLRPAKIHGVESQGMLLAATRKKQLSLVTVDQAIPNGTPVS